MTTLLRILLLFAVPAVGMAADGTTPPAVADDPPRAGASSTSGAEYTVGVRDTISVDVVAHPEFRATTQVTSRGTIVLPILREIEVKGLTAEEIRGKVTSLIADGFLKDPNVLVDVVQFFNMKVWVFGGVATPGEHELDGPTSILQLLSKVGNLTEEAGSTLTIERRRSADEVAAEGVNGNELASGDTETITVDLQALLLEGDLGENVALRNGDKVYVPPSTSKVYAFGEVNRPGFYPYRQGLNLAQLIELAGGFTEFASKKKVRIRRPSLPKPIEVNLKDYYKSGDLEENVPLQEGDIVIVNSSFFF